MTYVGSLYLSTFPFILKLCLLCLCSVPYFELLWAVGLLLLTIIFDFWGPSRGFAHRMCTVAIYWTQESWESGGEMGRAQQEKEVKLRWRGLREPKTSVAWFSFFIFYFGINLDCLDANAREKSEGRGGGWEERRVDTAVLKFLWVLYISIIRINEHLTGQWQPTSTWQ